MSGKPNYPEITALLLHIQRINALGDSIGSRSKVILDEEKARAAEMEERGDLLQKCKKLIEGMDVESQGNYGFEGRYHWFLLELTRQAETSGRLNS